MEQITVVTLPDQKLLDAVSPLPEGMRGGVWDCVGRPAGVELEEIQMVVLPYATRIGNLVAVRGATNLRLVQTQSTGFDAVPELVGKDVAVASASGVHAAATAELAVGLVLASVRGIAESVRDQAKGHWNPSRWPGLADRKVGIIGVGGIGEEIRRRLDPFEVEMTRFGSRSRIDEHGRVRGIDELLALAPGLEVLICIVPHNESTHHLINAEVMAALPDGAVIVNVARGPVVDTDALVAEVASGRLRMASDVFDPEPLPAGHPLWKLPNALIVPHNGGNTNAFPPRIAALLKRQLAAVSRGILPENVVRTGTRLG
ncbi:2-hydroxyacid dehydrogenase [Paeniglutamicibacter cryotolerans]|uniref:Phosphoglycerate dehydrogenase-like enzyme n=1 Tax=Paeniglutamicibacter cryotolerans TaxID=670079 RepID=A0A839QJ90_9MICC|nr:2-hydroxyacid dehydrogenase [Paeniglutamicibacter cryotolerans]MBB2996478.1 phosphoglycerate dehydrogenase-like enzyme [Paeniglutamicibacter cryotolerans]